MWFHRQIENGKQLPLENGEISSAAGRTQATAEFFRARETVRMATGAEPGPLRAVLFQVAVAGIPKLLVNGIPACDEDGPNDACTIRLLLQSPNARRDYSAYPRVCVADALDQSPAPADLRQAASRTLESPRDSLLFHNALRQMLPDDCLDSV